MKSSEKQKGSGNIERSLLQGEGNRYARGIHIWRIWEGNLEKAAFKHGQQMRNFKLKLKLQYFGHLMRRADSFEKTLMLGNMNGLIGESELESKFISPSPFGRSI